MVVVVHLLLCARRWKRVACRLRCRGRMSRSGTGQCSVHNDRLLMVLGCCLVVRHSHRLQGHLANYPRRGGRQRQVLLLLRSHQRGDKLVGHGLWLGHHLRADIISPGGAAGQICPLRSNSALRAAINTPGAGSGGPSNRHNRGSLTGAFRCTTF